MSKRKLPRNSVDPFSLPLVMPTKGEPEGCEKGRENQVTRGAGGVPVTGLFAIAGRGTSEGALRACIEKVLPLLLDRYPLTE